MIIFVVNLHCGPQTAVESKRSLTDCLAPSVPEGETKAKMQNALILRKSCFKLSGQFYGRGILKRNYRLYF